MREGGGATVLAAVLSEPGFVYRVFFMRVRDLSREYKPVVARVMSSQGSGGARRRDLPFPGASTRADT